MATKSNSRKDFTQIAFDVVQQATGEAERKTELTGKKADSRKGGLRGGKSRMEALTKEQRSELGKQAAKARWQNTAPTVEADAVKPKLTKQR
jgi:hypothetical protein